MKKRLIQLLTVALVMVMTWSAVGARAEDEPEAPKPYFTAEGSKLTLHTNGQTVSGIKYMYTDREYEYTSWNAYVREGKKNTEMNSTAGYRSLRYFTDGYTFRVEEAGWYNFIITYNGKASECFAPVRVSIVSNEPSIRVSGAAITIDPGDFTVNGVKWVYAGESECNCTTWAQMYSKGLEDKLHNGSAGYRTLTGDFTSTEYTFDVSGWYAFLITYNMGEVICNVQITNGSTLPYVTAADGFLTVHFGDYAVTGCKYIWTENAFQYTTWSKFVAAGKLNTTANTATGYRTIKSCTDGCSVPATRTGYYTFVLNYTTDGQVGETAVTVNVSSGASLPSATADGDDSIITVNHEDVTLTNIKYMYAGSEPYTYTNLTEFAAKGKEHIAANTTTGYRSITTNMNTAAGTAIKVDTAGWYTFILTYTDGQIVRNVEVSQEQADYHKPYADIDDMTITLYANGSNLYEILYMYTYDPYTYSTWNSFKSTGTLNTYINSTAGYRSIEATGDTSFTCFEQGYYTFILKYIDDDGVKRERYTTVSPDDLRASIYLQTMGGTVVSSDWDVAEDNPTLYTRKTFGTIALPTPSVPMGSQILQFAGWYTDLNYTTQVTTVDAGPGTDGNTYYAKWTFSASEYGSSTLHFLIGSDTKYGSPASSYTSVWGLNGTTKIKITCDHRGFHDYWSCPGTVTNTNTTAARSGTPVALPAAAGASAFKKVTGDLYIAKAVALNGNYVESSYILYNAGSSDVVNFSIGGAGDVNIAGNGYVPIKVNSDANGEYMLMEEGTYAFRIYVNDGDYWIGCYKSSDGRIFYQNVFNTSSDRTNKWDQRFSASMDSALCFSFRNFDIPAGQYVVKTARIGVGSVGSMGSSSSTVVTTYANGGAFADETTSKTVSVSANKIAINTLEIPVRAGFTFAGWNTSNVGAGNTYTEDDYASNINLYALWTKVTTAATYKLYNHSYVTAGAGGTKLGSATAKITLNYAGGLVQQGMSTLNAVSTDEDFSANIAITSGYYLPENIAVKVGSTWLVDGVGYIYTPSADKTGGTLVIKAENLTANAHVYIYGTDNPAQKPSVTVEDKDCYVDSGTTLTAEFTHLPNYIYTYQWYLTYDRLGTRRKALSSAAAKTANLAFGNAAPGVYYYLCKVKGTRSDGQTVETVSNVGAVTVTKRTNDATVIVDEDGNVSVSSNPDNAVVEYTFYTDADCTEKTSYENGASEMGGKPLKPLESGNYYVQAHIAESRNNFSCLTEPAVYDELPDLPFITTTGYLATLNDNSSHVTAVKYMYSAANFSYTTWKRYTAQGKLNTAMNTKNGYRTVSASKDAGGNLISMDGTVIEMTKSGYYTFLITFGGGKEVAYTFYCSDSDLEYHKPGLYQPTSNGRLVLISDNSSNLVAIKYMYSATEYTYTTWHTFHTIGKQNTTVNGSAGYKTITGSVNEGVSSLDDYAITLSNEGWYTFILTYDNGLKEKYQTIYVTSDYESNTNMGLLLVNNGRITASTKNGDEIVYIKFRGDTNYRSGNTLTVSATGTYNIQVVDRMGYTYYLVAYVNTLTNGNEETVDKSALLAKLTAAETLYQTYRDAASESASLAPGQYVLTADKAAFAEAIAEAREAYNSADTTQAEVNDYVTYLNEAMNTFKAGVFTVSASIISVDGNTITARPTSEDFSLKLLRYNAGADGKLTPSVWDNWTGFSSMKVITIKNFNVDGTYSFYSVPAGIYTFIAQQWENGALSEYYDYAVVCGYYSEAEVACSELETRLNAANNLLGRYDKLSDVDFGQTGIEDSKWNQLAARIAAAEALRDRLTAHPEDCNIKGEVIPMLTNLTRQTNQAIAAVGVKEEPVVFADINVVVNEDNSVSLTRGNLAYAFVSYGHYKKWSQISSAGYKKINAELNEDGDYEAVYRDALYNGEYTALVHYRDGSEEFKYFNISGITYPFVVSQEDGIINVTVNQGANVSKAGYCYGADVKNTANEFYVLDSSGANSYQFTAMGNGVHTVYVKIGAANYFVNIEVTTATKPGIVQNQNGGVGVFTHGLNVSAVGMKQGTYSTVAGMSGMTYPLTNKWLELASGTYTFYAIVDGEDTFITKVIR